MNLLFNAQQTVQYSEEKSVQLAEVHLYRSYILQNPYTFLIGSLGQHKTMYLQDNSASRVLEAALALLEVQEANKGHESQKQSKICLRKF